MRLAATLIAAMLVVASNAHADPYRLRADAIGITGAPSSPVGVVSLYGEDRARPWIDAEALVWAGAGAESRGPADALVVAVRLHDPTNAAELRLGRQIVAMGAIRPMHIDGALGRLRAPSGTVLETFGGVPVAPGFAYAAWDWIAGGRASQRLDRETTFGVSYMQAREGGRRAREEAGIDFASAPARWFDLGSHGAWDLVTPGLVEATLSVAGRFGKLRPELYATHRSPSRLLPATSLFSALGDIPSDTAGAMVEWHAAPRLDVRPSIALRHADADTGADVSLSTTLRLDDRGEGSVRVDLRRQGAGVDPFTGVRVATRVPFAHALAASTEMELAFLDSPGTRGPGPLPWGLIALGWKPAERWDVAAAVEAGASPSAVRSIDALVRVSRAWGGK